MAAGRMVWGDRDKAQFEAQDISSFAEFVLTQSDLGAVLAVFDALLTEARGGPPGRHLARRAAVIEERYTRHLEHAASVAASVRELGGK